MKLLIKDQYLPLIYEPGKGSWTYHIEIPDSVDMYCRRGYTKVAGWLDDYHLTTKNLAGITGCNKMISINQKIRKILNKNPGELIQVTLYLLPEK